MSFNQHHSIGDCKALPLLGVVPLELVWWEVPCYRYKESVAHLAEVFDFACLANWKIVEVFQS